MPIITLSSIPGFSDLSNAPLAANKPALGVHLNRISQNAAFGLVRIEVFSGIYKHGDTVLQPTSPVDGYVYSRNELMYMWVPQNTADPISGWASKREPYTMWYGIWNVDQTTGNVLSEIGYRGNDDNRDKTASTNDGNLQVFTIAQRQKTNLVIASTPAFNLKVDADFYTDAPLKTTAMLTKMNDNAKLGVVNAEVIYMGEFTNGQTVPKPVSPVDGRLYAYSEVIFQTSWRWTADSDGSGNPIKPAINKGQLQDWSASVDVSGIVRITNQKVFYELFGRNQYNTGKIAVFAFCTRPIGTTFPTVQTSFLELLDTVFAPGATLRASTMQQLNKNINQSVCSPEFFIANYANAANVPVPTSPLDGYVYARSELQYVWDWADTGPDPTSHGRLCLVRGGVDASGNVSIDKYRLASGASTVTLSHEGSIRVLVVARRASSNAIVVPIVLTPPDWAGDPIGDRWGDIVDANSGGNQLLQTIQVSGKPRTIADMIDLGSGQVGSQLLENAGFELLANPGSPDFLFAGWFDPGSFGPTFWTRTYTLAAIDPAFCYAGSRSYYTSFVPNQVIAIGSNAFVNLMNDRKVPCKPGELYFFRITLRTDANDTWPAGINFFDIANIRINSAAGGVQDVQLSMVPGIGTGFKTFSFSVAVPALCTDGTVPSFIQVYITSQVLNTSGAAVDLSIVRPGKLLFDTRWDSCEIYRAVNPTSDEIAKFGSMAPSFAGTLSFSKTATSVTWSWNVNVYRTDNGATVVNMTSSQAVTGLTASTLYFWYPFMDEADLLFKMVTTGGAGSTPNWAHTTTDRTWSVEQARADHVPLSATPLQVTTSAIGGSGSGSTPPPDNGCHREGTFVKERTKGVIPCEQTKSGDFLWDGDDRWTEVLAVDIKSHSLWIIADFNCHQQLPVTSGHPFELRDKSIKRAYELCLLDEVPCSTGIAHPVILRLEKKIANKVKISCARPNTFMAATKVDSPWVRSHNYNTL